MVEVGSPCHVRNKVSRGDGSDGNFSTGRGGGAIVSSSAPSAEGEKADQENRWLTAALADKVVVKKVRRSIAVKLMGETTEKLGAFHSLKPPFTVKMDIKEMQVKKRFFVEYLP
jgi:hypothetical protein